MTYSVTIAGVTPDPEVYAGLVKATAYIGAILSPAAAKWRALTPDDKARTAFSAREYIDTRSWAGAPTFAGGTTLQFPRSGGGITDDATTQLGYVEQAVYWLMMEIAANPAILTALNTSSNVKVVDADGARVEFFAPTSVADGNATTMPAVVQRLLGRYIASSAAGIAYAGGASFGTDGVSAFDDDDELGRSGGF